MTSLHSHQRNGTKKKYYTKIKSIITALKHKIIMYYKPNAYSLVMRQN